MNESSRKVLSGHIPLMPLFVKYQDKPSFCVEMTAESTIDDIISIAALHFDLDSARSMLSNQGMRLDPASLIAESGVSSECLLEIVEDQLDEYLLDKMSDLSQCVSLGIESNHNEETMHYYKGRIGMDASEDGRGTLQMNDTGIFSFEEFQNRVNEYLAKKGFVKTRSTKDNGLEITADYCVEGISDICES